MNKTSKAKGVLEILLVIGLILLIPLFFAIKSRANPQVVPNTAAPVVPTAVQNTEPLITTAPKQPPACTFPLAQTTTAESTPEEYTFSEPEVVLTSKYQIDIIEWLPDNQNVLIMPMDDHKFDGIDGYLQTIELFNPETQETKVYATRWRSEGAPPAWNPALNAVVYPYTNILGEDKTTKKLNVDRQVRISYGNPDDTQLLVNNLPQNYITVKPDGNQMAYLTEKSLVKIGASLNVLKPVPFDRKLQDYKHEFTVIYKMSWRPNSLYIFLYNEATDNLGYTYLLNTDTNELCNLNFDGWALVARWSPNGRYLAIIRAQSYVPIQSSDLIVLDTATGNLYTIELPQEVEGKRYVDDITWAPDNYHLFVIGSHNDYSSSEKFNEVLFLGDFITGRMDRVIPSHKFTSIWAGTNLAWSPDGLKLIMNCPISEETSQVCLISVQKSGQ